MSVYEDFMRPPPEPREPLSPDDEEGLIALAASIVHWRSNAKAGTCWEPSIGMPDCALCALHYRDEAPRDEKCLGCSVRETTGRDFCVGSPYPDASAQLHEWMRMTRRHARDHTAVEAEEVEKCAEEFRHRARLEELFLRSLWPAGACVEPPE